jgi:hypothetical protein
VKRAAQRVLAASRVWQDDAAAGEPGRLSAESAVDLMETKSSEAFPLSRIEDRLRRRAEGASLTGERLRKRRLP